MMRDDFPVSAVTVTDHQKSQAAAQTEKNEPTFCSGMVRVVKQLGVLVGEDSLRIIEADPMLSQVECGLLVNAGNTTGAADVKANAEARVADGSSQSHVWVGCRTLAGPAAA